MVSATLASAQTKLRWNLKKGDKFQVTTLQEMKMTATVQGMEIKTGMNIQIYSSWRVGSRGANGASQVTQTIDRVVMKMTSPVLNFKYDSADKEEPQGLAKQFSAAFGAILGVGSDFKLSPEGEVSDAKINEEAVEALKKNPLTAQAAGMFSKEGLKQMIGQLIAKFPKEGVKVGQTWTDTMNQDVANLGKMKVAVKYTYEGTEITKDGKLEKISFTMKTEIGELKGLGGAKIKIKIKEQSGKGVVYFDNVRGRFDHSQLDQSMIMDVSLGGTTFEQKIDVSAKMRMTPAKK